ncbi:Photosystem I assembly protein Ycf4, partial [Bienertia sinuspersici]
MSKSKLKFDFNAFSFISILLISCITFASSSSSSSSDLHRRDPLQHFKFYDGGYNLQNKHYWASAVFTGVHGYAVAGVWMLCGLGCGIFMITKNVCNSSDSSSVNHTYNNSDYSHFLLLVLILFFTLLA